MPDNTQGQDGQPHVTYYDKPHLLSFVWDGTSGPWIDVAYGGYAEPVFARIPLVEESVGANQVQDFKTSCDRFIDKIDESVSHTEDNR